MTGPVDPSDTYRALIGAIDEGFCVIDVIFDAGGEPVDYRFLEINPAFAAQTGLEDAVGRRMRDLAPRHEEHWFQIYGRIARTGIAERFEHRADALGRWYEVHAFPVGEAAPHRVGIVFRDVKARKLAEAAARESEVRYQNLFERM